MGLLDIELTMMGIDLQLGPIDSDLLSRIFNFDSITKVVFR